MKDVHIAVGVLAIALNAGAALYGGWCWWRGTTRADWFWRLLRSAQGVVVLQVALGGLLVAIGNKARGIHVLYGVLPLLVSVLAEQLRIGSAQAVLDARGLDSSKAVGELPEAEQRSVVFAIVHREIGVMALAAAVVVVLLARAAATAG